MAEAAKAPGGVAGAAVDKASIGAMIVAIPRLTVAQLQEELGRRGLDTKWTTPLKGKKELIARLTVRTHLHALCRNAAIRCWYWHGMLFGCVTAVHPVLEVWDLVVMQT